MGLLYIDTDHGGLCRDHLQEALNKEAFGAWFKNIKEWEGSAQNSRVVGKKNQRLYFLCA